MNSVAPDPDALAAHIELNHRPARTTHHPSSNTVIVTIDTPPVPAALPPVFALPDAESTIRFEYTITNGNYSYTCSALRDVHLPKPNTDTQTTFFNTIDGLLDIKNPLNSPMDIEVLFTPELTLNEVETLCSNYKSTYEFYCAIADFYHDNTTLKQTLTELPLDNINNAVNRLYTTLTTGTHLPEKLYLTTTHCPTCEDTFYHTHWHKLADPLTFSAVKQELYCPNCPANTHDTFPESCVLGPHKHTSSLPVQ